ncbi:tyrosine-type recombinase/integrase [Caproiciproducens galactitolivorans]|uniref:Tyrosine recombinase XerC n=1 Tax=Caproiciproducens galactitolivorans TaxID=642589 RepID=A0A4Z0XW16_9FIRM|nr:tyrosine-type recombinase/integrase [Caproiciproducens galactitolivorans]QEY33838.1 tyrosine-type recombinase/integrase [Caproiciproducens galactitolivorans]TGJ75534.1 tyrosine recombinase XerC [Caproiciproducens galactitolivorans]
MANCKKCKRNLSDDWIWCPWCGTKQTKPTRKRKTTRRENRTGSVYKRSDIKYRPWVAVTPKTKTTSPQLIGYYATSQEAKDALEEYRRNPVEKINITLKEIYEDWWALGTKNKSKQLANSYRAAWKKLSALYDEKFRELRTAQIQSIIDGLQKERPKLDKQGKPVVKDGVPVMLPPMSYSALHDIKVLVGLLYKYAMQNDIINKNYAEFLVLPKKPSGVKDCFNDIELKQIENAAFGTDKVKKVPFADCILFMCYTGLRITEFLTLSKFNVHEKNGMYALYGGIKTDAGKNKVVPVHHKIKPILMDWMSKNGETIFCRLDGAPYTSQYFREKCFYPALEQIGITRKLTPHATRRTFATMMSAANVREEDFIAIMGHTDYSVDIDSYISQSAEKLSKSIEKLP